MDTTEKGKLIEEYREKRNLTVKKMLEIAGLSFAESKAVTILDNGVFGFNNKDNEGYIASNHARNSRFPQLAMVQGAVRNVFPSYDTMIKSENNSFLRGKAWLLPVGWIHRFSRGVKQHKVGDGKKIITGSFVSKENLEKREQMYRWWGI